MWRNNSVSFAQQRNSLLHNKDGSEPSRHAQGCTAESPIVCVCVFSVAILAQAFAHQRLQCDCIPLLPRLPGTNMQRDRSGTHMQPDPYGHDPPRIIARSKTTCVLLPRSPLHPPNTSARGWQGPEAPQDPQPPQDPSDTLQKYTDYDKAILGIIKEVAARWLSLIHSRTTPLPRHSGPR